MREMRAKMALVMLTTVLVLLVAGCGGGGQEAAVGPPAPGGGGSGSTMEIGPMLVQTARTGNFKAESLPTKGDCTFVALYGAQIDYLASTAMLDRVVFVKSGGVQLSSVDTAGVGTRGDKDECCSLQMGGYRNIYVCNLDGSGLVRLTNNSTYENTPRWSPDGTKIVFSRSTGPEQEIFMMNADGTGVTQLTFDGGWWPDWSPDGRQLTCTKWTGGGRNVVCTMNADGSNELEIPILAGGQDPTDTNHSTWSPDGTKLALAASYGGNYEVATYDLYSGNLERLTSADYFSLSPAWDHSGKTQRIAYMQWGWDAAQPPSLWVMSPDGTNQRKIFASGAGAGAYQETPRWSSDGSLIAFYGWDEASQDVWIGEVDAPYRLWQVTTGEGNNVDPDLGSPTVQTERVLIGPDGSDRGGNNPLWTYAPAAIVAFDAEGYRNMVRIGVADEHVGTMQIRPMANVGAQVSGIEVSATDIANVRQDVGWGKWPTVWRFLDTQPGMLLLLFNANTGKLVSVVATNDSVYATAAGGASPAYTATAAGDGVQLTGSFSGVFDAEGRNLAESGASSVTLGADGQVLQVN
jgi:dipeptidyl aminopeptidase/acylaminoacyl peptidase